MFHLHKAIIMGFLHMWQQEVPKTHVTAGGTQGTCDSSRYPRHMWQQQVPKAHVTAGGTQGTCDSSRYSRLTFKKMSINYIKVTKHYKPITCVEPTTKSQCALRGTVNNSRASVIFMYTSCIIRGPLMVAQCLRYCATNRKVAGSIPDGVIGIFHWHDPSDRTMALGSTQPLTEMSTRSISWG
jgi:hypothetical protein